MARMSRLFTYIIPIDDGAAPNPFWGICTLNICKPGIRRVAQETDWVAGFGSKKAPSGNLSGKLVYAMKITKVLLMRDYDAFAQASCPRKIPHFSSTDSNDRLGDAIYDFNTSPPFQRRGVHKSANQPTDISGRNCLLSDHFVYFGRNAINLPDDLLPIICQSQGHRSTKNDCYVSDFIKWIEKVMLVEKFVRGEPDYEIDWRLGCGSGCDSRQNDEDIEEGCQSEIK